MVKQTKADKEKAKKVKEGIANFNFKVAQKHEKYQLT